MTPTQQIAAWRSRGIDVTEGPPVRMPGGETAAVKADRKQERPAAPQFAPALRVWEGNRLIVVVPVETRSESNLRDWRARSRRSGAAWKAVRAAVDVGDFKPFQDAIRLGRCVHVTLTRLGGRRLDAMDNLPASLKAVADVVCFLIGVDDANPLFRATCEQEPAGLTGVRIELQ